MRELIEPYDIRAWNEWHKMIRGSFAGQGDVCSAWRETFHNFVADIGRPEKGQRLKRHADGMPFRQSNCYWG